MSLSTRTQIRQALREFEKRNLKSSVSNAGFATESEVNALIEQYLIDNPVGGSVSYVTESLSGLISVNSGASTIFDIAGQADKRIKLTALGFGGSTTQTGYTLTSGTTTIFSNKTLAGTTTALSSAASAITIGFGGGSSDSVNIYEPIESKMGEGFKLVKDSGTSSNPIYYAYEVLVKDE